MKLLSTIGLVLLAAAPALAGSSPPAPDPIIPEPTSAILMAAGLGTVYLVHRLRK